MVEAHAKTYEFIEKDQFSNMVIDAFNVRAQKLKTRLQTKKLQYEEEQRNIKRQGMSAKQFWQTYVNSEESAFEFYKLYYPQYPELLQRALASKITQVINKYNSQQELSPEEKRLIDKSFVDKKEPPQEHLQNWDLKKDIEEQLEAIRSV